MELLLASMIHQRLNDGDFDPDGSNPLEAAYFVEWLEADEKDWDRKVDAAVKAIGSNVETPPPWALLTCFVRAEEAKVRTANSSSDVRIGYALDQLIFYLLEADERHRTDLENQRSRRPPDEPESDEPYDVADTVSVDKAARWVCGGDDEEFEKSELKLREALRRFETGPLSSKAFHKRTILRAWTREQDAASEGGCESELTLIEGYKNTERMTRVERVWEAWHSERDKVLTDYAGLFALLSGRQ